MGDSLPGQRTDADEPTKVVIVTPVYDDWDSLLVLLEELRAQAVACGFALRVVAVDDGSDSRPTGELAASVVALTCNVGHQRAIAIGLAYAHATLDFDVVVVMDADGEDRPGDLPRLLEEHLRSPGSIVVAERARRSEGLQFRAFYRLYKWTFRLLIGRAISFGNFALIPRERLERLLLMPELWNHLAATYMRSRIPLRKVELARGSRYAGASRMNMPALVTHGLSAISVFSDTLVARVLLASAAMFAAAVLGVAVAVGVRFGTDLAIAGWATNAVGLMIVVSLQALLMSLMSAFLLLSGRNHIPVSLPSEYRRFVHSVTTGQANLAAPHAGGDRQAFG